jgi:hypothetical protein
MPNFSIPRDEPVERGVTRLPEQRLSTLITCEFLGFLSSIGTSPTLIFDPYFSWKPQDVGAVDPQKTPPETVPSVNSACILLPSESRIFL